MSALYNSEERDAFCQRFAAYHNNPALSDFTIICRGAKWNVHRFVLSVHSEVFAKSCDGNFKETQEAVLDLSEHEEPEVAALVYYLYNFEYDIPQGHSNWGLFHLKMALLADKYFITGLVSAANREYDGCICLFDDEKVIANHAQLAYAVPHATEQIRYIIVRMVVAGGMLRDNKQCELLNVMRQHAEFGVDIALEMARRARKLAEIGPWDEEGTHNFFLYDF
ncbi:unnamed protein product [Zymoseptoria tritici ST99CH_1A5]|uniref:BTB domain-containing protein n=3 Tax=Zymoseptoria tritici TaxID=1047171 RepID=A0A1X7RVY9_ZYMT9|nr:unnamed protein product [Zymoseptoria tritici ST99CH_3D7]SMR53012.1 unnamed protein product [Zymoseptoria tritici ST99CH_1E4]SMR54554.1 unnamed protein product [Zymoseptoria tritici ST99CH_3D1]SMY24760.1 unnamed protein product [Zymoseptoria tritici ST99CH_1A5]